MAAAVKRRKSSPKYRSNPHAGTAPVRDVKEQADPIEEDVQSGPTPQQMREAVAGILGRLQMSADEQVRLKSVIEDRWIENLRRYNSRYDKETEARLQDPGSKNKSKVFANKIRPKTVAWESRLSDLQFPTDDKNYGIEPTPVPELTDAARQAAKDVDAAKMQANDALAKGDEDGAAQLAEQGTLAARAGMDAEAQMEVARERAIKMEKVIEDQLEECHYNISARETIHDLCKLGTGIMKGPIATAPKRRAWQKVQPEQAPANGQPPSAAIYQLGAAKDNRPTYVRADPWNFFPDMSARTIESAEFTFERHLCTKKDLRKLARDIEFDVDAVRQLLTEAPRTGMPSYVALLREINKVMQPVTDARYHVWEYRGPLEREDLVAVGNSLQIDIAKIFDDDPLRDVDVVIWFCQGHLLFFGPGPLESCESIYSVVPFERDEASMFGIGVPDLGADGQIARNSAWRMMLDNAALCVGPQIVVDQSAITPADGDWTLKSMKVWLTSTTSLTKLPEGYKPFMAIDIPSHQDKLGNIIEIADRFIDEETFMPNVAEGEQGTHQQTAQGMSMLMNSANVVFRRVVKNFDDFLTTPNIRRLYDWNMQFHKDDSIKGDYEVKARGSSVLIVRELQLQNLHQMLATFSAHPVIGPMGKWANAFRKYVQASHISPDELVKSDDVIKQEALERARQAAAMTPQKGKSKEELDQEAKLATDTNQMKMQIAEMQRETALITLATNSNMSLEDLKTKLAMQQQDHAHKERVVAAEAALPKPAAIGGAEF